MTSMVPSRPGTRLRLLVVSLLLLPLWLAPNCWSATRTQSRRAMNMKATAFAVDSQPTAAGTAPQVGIVAADPLILPLGTRIRVTGAGAYSGIYLVTEKGSKVKGRHIDLYLPTAAEAKQFGSRTVRVQVLDVGTGKADARAKDAQQ